MANGVIRQGIVSSQEGGIAKLQVGSKNQVVSLKITPSRAIDTNHPEISIDFYQNKIRVYTNTGEGFGSYKEYNPIN